MEKKYANFMSIWFSREGTRQKRNEFFFSRIDDDGNFFSFQYREKCLFLLAVTPHRIAFSYISHQFVLAWLYVCASTKNHICILIPLIIQLLQCWLPTNFFFSFIESSISFLIAENKVSIIHLCGSSREKKE